MIKLFINTDDMLACFWTANISPYTSTGILLSTVASSDVFLHRRPTDLPKAWPTQTCSIFVIPILVSWCSIKERQLGHYIYGYQCNKANTTTGTNLGLSQWRKYLKGRLKSGRELSVYKVFREISAIFGRCFLRIDASGRRKTCYPMRTIVSCHVQRNMPYR